MCTLHQSEHKILEYKGEEPVATIFYYLSI